MPEEEELTVYEVNLRKTGKDRMLGADPCTPAHQQVFLGCEHGDECI
jgi:hypothetical protein